MDGRTDEGTGGLLELLSQLKTKDLVTDQQINIKNPDKPIYFEASTFLAVAILFGQGLVRLDGWVKFSFRSF